MNVIHDNLQTSDHPASILLVDDDVTLCDMLCDYLSAEGFMPTCAHGGLAALAELKTTTFDLIVLDIMMPDMNGLDVLQSLRAQHATPVIMLTGRGDDIDRIIGLDMGADDYLAKPCNPRELVSRIRAVLRRAPPVATQASSPAALSLAGVQLDLATRSVVINDTLLNFTSAEFNTLAMLVQHNGQIVSKEALTEKVLQRKLTAYDRSIDVHVSRVRQKLHECIGDNHLITTVRGSGYQFCGGNG